MTLLRAENIHMRFGAMPVLRGAGLEVARGETVGLLGPNAAGKTTLLRILAGLVEAASGTIRFDGADAATLDAATRARRIAYLEQNAACHWPIAVERLVLLGRLPHLGPWRGLGPADREAAARAMESCDLAHLATRPVTALSGGEQARAMLARALATGPELILADEPVSHLDPAHRIRVMELMRAHAATGGAALVILHDLTLAARFCDRLVLLADGEVAAAGPPAEVLTPDILAAVFGITAAFLDEGDGLMVVPRARVPQGGAGGTP
jgi:iron complex transport system ATP-binding protein